MKWLLILCFTDTIYSVWDLCSLSIKAIVFLALEMQKSCLFLDGIHRPLAVSVDEATKKHSGIP